MNDRPINDSRDCDAQVLIECDLPEAPEKVWRALTEPELVAQWLSGAREIVAAEPNARVRYRLRDREQDESGAGEQTIESFVTFELSRTSDGGTHLRLVHSDFAVVADVIVMERRARTSGSGTPPQGTPIMCGSWRRAA